MSCGEPVENLKVKVLSVLPHDPQAFTEGLLSWGGLLYESTGLYGDSTLRKVDPQTGEILHEVELASEYFGEGLARVDDLLVQLTYREGLALLSALDDFTPMGHFTYQG
jgi:glutamine cyclotransferase